MEVVGEGKGTGQRWRKEEERECVGAWIRSEAKSEIPQGVSQLRLRKDRQAGQGAERGALGSVWEDRGVLLGGLRKIRWVLSGYP